MQIDRNFQQGQLLLDPAQLNLTYLKSFLCYPAERELPDYVQSFLSTAVLPRLAVTPVRYQYRLLPVKKHLERTHTIELSAGPGKFVFQGPVIYQLLKDCSHCLVFLLNLTGTIEDDPLQAFLSYSSFNSILQTALDLFKKEITQILSLSEPGLTRRFAPGYCGWAIQEQQKILSLLDPAAMGVHLTTAQMLDPPHSLTGVYGLRRDVKHTEKIPCYTCTSVTCSVHLDFPKYNSAV
jgi:hypothetical protein